VDGGQVVAAPGTLVVPTRFEGPPGTANGGWIAGALADRLADAQTASGLGWAAEVVLRAPTPLNVALAAEPAAGGGVRLVLDETVLVEAQAARAENLVELPPFVGLAAAQRAVAGFTWFPDGGRHPFPNCFGCGTGRAQGDGLRLLPAPVPGGPPGLVATPWTVDALLASPDGTIGRPLLWSALDCPSFWAHQAAAPADELAALLARQTVTVAGPVRPGETYVVVARAEAAEGRKLRASSAVYALDGTLVAASTSLWIRIPPLDRG